MLSIILSTLTLFFVLFLLFLVVLPLKKVNSYKADRVTTYFFPVIGFFNYINKALKETNDVMANSKELHSVSSRPKYLVTNSSANVLIFLKDPQYIKEFLQRPNLYHKSKITKSLAPLTGAGLLIAEDDVWKRHRKIVSTSFHFDFLKANVSTMKNTTVEFFEKVQPNEYQNYPAISKVQEITGEIVGRMFFGENLNSYNFEGKTLTLALAEITSELAIQRMTAPVLIFGPKVLEIPLFPTYRKIMQKVKRFRKACSDIIQDRKSKPQANSSDLLSSLLATQQLPDPELRFSDEDIVSEFITFFIAGMDTTGHLIAMALYNLTQYPQYLPQLEAERQKLYNTKGQELTTEALAGMEQLHAFLKETLRFYTPAPFTFVRQAMYDHEIVDLKIKKGDLVFPDLLSSAYDEKNFEKPLEFSPARWLGANTKLDPYAFIPFSAGPRNCIGQHLAMMEAKVIVSEFLERYDFSLQEGYKLRMRIRLLYEPEEEIFLNLSRKS